MEKLDHLILGHGYTAKELTSFILKKEPACLIRSTSRKGGDHILFDLEDSGTWSNLPNSRYLYWTFAAEPHDKVKDFYKKCFTQFGQIIVVGTTSGFMVEKENQEINESTPLDLSLDRVKGEVYLKEQEAILVMSSGIYGPGRNPIDWIKKGWVGRSEKFVNMIHVTDLCQILYQAGQIGKRGEVYIASDGLPQQWCDVIDQWESCGFLSQSTNKKSTKLSKKINSQRTLKELKVSLKYQNFANSVFAIGPES